MKSRNIIFYTPEQWGVLEKFSNFYSATHDFNDSGKRAVLGTISHFRKALTLKNLALKLVPNLENDEVELNEYGYSSAINSKELSAVIESIILELYSSLDCSITVICKIYSKYQGIPDSTRKYFKNVSSLKIDKRFPEQLIIAVQEATWYDDFRKIRDELTHLETGNCHKNDETGKIVYMHPGLKRKGVSLIINDIFAEIDQMIAGINQFLGRVFAYLYSQLDDKPILQTCGIFNGRAYARYVSPHESMDFHSGICDARRWFDLEENPTCIFASECGAYKNANNVVRSKISK